MKKFLVPCDFSKPAINAFRFALSVAAETHATIHLMHIIELPVVVDPILISVPNYQQGLRKELTDQTMTEFEKLNHKYNKDNIHTVVKVDYGSPSAMLLDYIKEEKFDLVVMGSHGASGFREFMIGSNAEKIVRASDSPVLVVKQMFKGTIRNIVFPNTLETEFQEELIHKVKALQHLFKAHLHIVWINTPFNFTSDTKTNARLENFARKYAFKDYTISIFNHRNEEDGIVEFNRMIGGDLIALGTHGRKGIAHIVGGSLAEDLANHADTLVWTCKMKETPMREIKNAIFPF